MILVTVSMSSLTKLSLKIFLNMEDSINEKKLAKALTTMHKSSKFNWVNKTLTWSLS